MKEYKVEDIAYNDVHEELVNIPDVVIVFSDGVKKTISGKWAFLNSFWWRIWRILGDNIPINSEWVMNEDVFTPKLPGKIIITPLMEWLVKNDRHDLIYTLLAATAETSVLVSNRFNTVSNMTSWDNKDVLELRDDTVLRMLEDRSPESCQAIMDYWVKTYPDNAIVLLIRGGIIKPLAVQQTLISMGMISNGKVPFKRPVTPSFWEGMAAPFQVRGYNGSPLTEEQEKERLDYGSANTIMLTSLPMRSWGAKGALQDSEAFRRQFSVHIYGGRKKAGKDCGTTVGTVHVINGKLKRYDGLMYKINPEDPWKILNVGTDTHLVGVKVLLRTNMSCRNGLDNDHHRESVCDACLGPITHQLAQHASPAHIMISAATQMMGQNALAMKHQSSTEVKKDANPLSGNETFLYSEEYLYKNPVIKEVRLVSGANCFSGLSGLLHMRDMSNIIPPNTVGNADVLFLHINGKIVELPLASKIMFSNPLMEWARKNKKALILDNGGYQLDLGKYPKSKPLFQVVKAKEETMNVLEVLHRLTNGTVEEKEDLRYKPHHVFQRFTEDMDNIASHHVGMLATLMPTITSHVNSFKEPGNGHGDDSVMLSLSGIIGKGCLRTKALYTGYSDGMAQPSMFMSSGRPHFMDGLLGSSAID